MSKFSIQQDKTQLVTSNEFVNYDTKKSMLLSNPIEGQNETGAIKFSRIRIGNKNPDRSVGCFVAETLTCFCFGISESSNPDTNVLTGYKLPLCLWSKDNPTEIQKKWSSKLEEIIDYTRDHIISIKDDLSGHEETTLTSLQDEKKAYCPLKFSYPEKDDKGKPIRKIPSNRILTSGPIFSPKLNYSKKENKILTRFFNEDGDELDPQTLISTKDNKKMCHVRANVHIESIFIGQNIYFQCKVMDAMVKFINSGMKSLLRKTPLIIEEVEVGEGENIPGQNKSLDLNSDDDNDDSIKDSDSEEETKDEKKEEEIPKKKVIVRRVVKKKT